MSKKILISLSVIGVVAAIVIGATTAYFSDTETSKGNTLTAGIIDIVVDDENPWTADFTEQLTDMKPSYTKYIEFTVRNLEESNEVNLWKHIKITDQNDGVISEPECTEGGGKWTGGGTVCSEQETCCTASSGYIPRNNLAAYIIYDMYVCENPTTQTCATDGDGKPIGSNWITIISEDQNVRLDNVSSAWIKIGQLTPAKELKVVQSYHLRSWPGAPEPDVTNWAQGDELTFDIELMATQLNAPGPKGYFATLNMVGKNPITWATVPGASGLLTYNTAGSTFDYNFSGTGLDATKGYCLIYYADPWPGTGGLDIECKSTDGAGVLAMNGSKDIGSIPVVSDSNHPAGAKIWLVPSADYDTGANKMIGWSPSTYLFEMQFITYDKI